jgi:MFS family permease
VTTEQAWRPLRDPGHQGAWLTLPDSPFGRLAVTHGLAAAGDALVTLALSDSLFFSAGAEAARGKVLLYLVLTLLPFVVLAPYIGPLVDRHADGRRWTIVIGCASRSLLCLLLVGHLDGLLLYPLAFGVLVASKSYAVARSSLVPAVVSHDDEVIPANSRLTVLAAVAAFVILIPGGIARVIFHGSGVVGLACIVFAAAAAAGIRLRTQKRVSADAAAKPNSEPIDDAPTVEAVSTGDGSKGGASTSEVSKVDVSKVEVSKVEVSKVDDHAVRAMFRVAQERAVSLRLAVVAMSLLRTEMGLLTFLVSFTFKRGDAPLWQIGLVATLGIVGQNVGAALAPLVGKGVSGLRVLTAALIVIGVACLLCSFNATRGLTAILAAVIGLGAGVGRVSFDSIVQRNVPEAERSSAYARFETRFQLYWVFGALVPVMVSVQRSLGFVLMAVIGAVGASILIVGEPALTRLENARTDALARWRKPDRILEGEE